MSFLANQWVGYIDKTYEQIKANALVNLTNKVPEITDHNPSNPVVKMLEVWAGIAELLNYYTDNVGRETFIDTVRVWSNAVKIASAYDYRLSGYQPSYGTVTFVFTNPTPTIIPPTIIPSGTTLTSINGITFTVDSAVSFDSGGLPVTSISVGVVVAQYIIVTNAALGVGTGVVKQQIVITDKIFDGTLQTRVNAILWSSVESFAFSLPTDQHTRFHLNEDRDNVVEFGDGINGAIPQIGDTITANYKATLGAAGNVLANTIINTTYVPPVGFTVAVTNPQRTTGGTNGETIDSMRKNLPLAIRTKYTAVSRQDFIDIAELHPQVIKAEIDFKCGQTVGVYIVPNGGGIASLGLLANVQNYMDERRMIGVFVDVKSAGEVSFSFDIQITVLPTYNQAGTKEDVIDALLAFFDFGNQNIGGTVYLSDIYEVIEGVKGVSNSQVLRMTPTSYARPISPNNAQLNWSIVMLAGSISTIVWRIIFTSASQFVLLKDGNQEGGTYTVGVAVVFPELEFTINVNYALNDTWEFVSYPYGFVGNIDLIEYSLPVTVAPIINVVAQGGI